MKSYTDVPQSKILAEFLPTESADCCYIKYCTSDNNEWRYEGQPPMFLGEIPITEITAEHIPCWSLAALLDVLPSATLDSSDDHHYRVHCRERFTEWHDNAVDACVEIILKLHKEDLL